MTGPAVVLASSSAARAALLRSAGVRFEILPARVDEAALKAALLGEGSGPRDIADALAEAKALQVSSRTAGLVLGADQTLDLEGELFDKPDDLEQARRQLIRLRGRTHSLHSAAVICLEGRPVWRGIASARLQVRSFSEAFLDAYLEEEGDALLTSCGAYRIEGPGAQLFARVEGDLFTVQGLPLIAVLEQLRLLGALLS